MSAVRTIAMELAPAAGSVGEARSSLEALRGTVKDDLLEDLRLLVSEVVTNCVRHAGLGPRDSVALHVVAEPTRLRAEIVDAGRGFEAPVHAAPAPGASSGWGLFLVGRVADRWGVERLDGRTRVWFEIDR